MGGISDLTFSVTMVVIVGVHLVLLIRRLRQMKKMERAQESPLRKARRSSAEGTPLTDLAKQRRQDVLARKRRCVMDFSGALDQVRAARAKETEQRESALKQRQEAKKPEYPVRRLRIRSKEERNGNQGS